MQKDMHQFFVASTDPIERRQAPALQMILIAISSAALVALIVFLAVLGVNPTGGVPAGGAVLVMLKCPDHSGNLPGQSGNRPIHNSSPTAG